VPNRLSDSSDAGSSRTGSSRRPADFGRIAASDNETRKKEIQRYYDSGEEHLKAGRYKEAHDDFNRVIALDGNHARAFARRGRAYLELRQFKEALADFNQALKLEKDNIYALGHRGITYREMGQYEKALADFNQVLALGYSRPWIRDQVRDLERKKEIQRYYDSGEEHLKARRYKEARDDFDRVIALDGNHARAFARRGRAYLELRQFKEALADFNQALKLEKDNPYTLGHRGITYREMGQYEKALADFKRILALGHSQPWIRDQVRDLERQVLIEKYYDSGEKHIRARQYKKARRNFNRVIALDRKHARAFARRGRAYLELKQFKRALADFKRARHLGYSQSRILDQIRQYFEGMCQK
jgi:tetratricopeptide (TPR) repeat protein